MKNMYLVNWAFLTGVLEWQTWLCGGSGRLFISSSFCLFFHLNLVIVMASDASTSPTAFQNFELVCSLSANNLIPVHKYKSTKTGLTVIVSEVDGPVVNGYFCVATEAHDDDGLPHTLEHLIFLGSEKYPYKGVLDLMANRLLASGTNAWTDTDHTCYTVNNAGSEGFLSLLPIYLDHILYPTLTESAFITEVHHVNEEGRDGGVVYTEMQGRENSGESRVYLELMRAVYPGDCGYKSETAGIMKNLRESTNNEKVRNFHKKFYRPENLYVIVVGNVKPVQVLETLGPFEENVISKGPRGAFTKPWQEPIPELTNSVDKLVPYASDEEINGMVYIAWRGPCVTNDIYGLTACSILLKYLTDTSVSPLPKEFVEIPDPYASKVSYSLVENAESLLMLQFENVPVEKLDTVKQKLDSVFESMLTSNEVFDMDRLETVINKHRLECLSHLENSPHDTIAYIVIGHMLYGNTVNDLNQRLNIVKDLEKMASEGQAFWIELLRKYFVDSKSITIRGRPSVEEQKRITNEEEERVAERIKELGPAGLKQKGEIVSNAAMKNELPAPEEMLTSEPIPTVDSIKFHEIKAYSTISSEQHPLFNISQVPVFMQLDNLNTNFVYIFVLMDSSGVSPELRRYLPLLSDCLLESPLQREDQLIPYEEVVAELERDTIAAATRLGLESSSRFHCGPFCTTVSLMLQVEPKKYEKAIEWIREILFQTIMTEERVRIIATKIMNNVAEIKRKGSSVVYDLMRSIVYTKKSNHQVTSVLRQYKFLSEVVKVMSSTSGVAKVLEDLNALRAALTRPENMVVHMAANIEQLADLIKPANGLASFWEKLLPDNLIPNKHNLKVVPDWSLLASKSDPSGGVSCIAGMGSIESNYLCLTTPCIRDFNHPDLPAILVFFQYLTQLEGPLWKHIRGQGLAYGYNIVPRPHEALLYFTLYKASNVVGAYKEAKEVIEEKLKTIDSWDTNLLESAKSSLIFEIIHREKCIGDVVAQSVLSYFKGVNHNYNRDLVQRTAQVKITDLQNVGPKYVVPMFNPELSKTSVVCHPSKVEEVAKGLNMLGLNLSTYPSLEDSFLNEW